VWDEIVADLVAHIGKGQAGEGFVRAIKVAGEQLARHFPPERRHVPGLSNHLIVLPAA
jgi:uncharacterized membrane protein